MNLHEELVSVVGALDANGVEYALVGGLALAVWGAPRATDALPVCVISREALIAMKVAAGRPQDQADVIKLQEQDR